MTSLSARTVIGDQTRARSGKGYGLADDRITLATDFECGNGCRPRRDGDGYALDLEPEPGNHRFGGKAYFGFQAFTRLGGIAHMVKYHGKHPLDAICRHAVASLRLGCACRERVSL